MGQKRSQFSDSRTLHFRGVDQTGSGSVLALVGCFWLGTLTAADLQNLKLPSELVLLLSVSLFIPISVTLGARFSPVAMLKQTALHYVVPAKCTAPQTVTFIQGETDINVSFNCIFRSPLSLVR